MPHDDNPTNLTVLTPQQAMDLFQRLAPGSMWLLLAVPAPSEQHPEPLQPHPPTDVEALPPHGLERFVAERPNLLSKLITFNFIGCAYSDGAESLHAVSKALHRRKKAKALIPVPPHSTSALSVLLTDLAEAPFAAYLRKPYPVFLEYAEGQPGVLSADGWTAWEATQDYLALRGLLPTW